MTPCPQCGSTHTRPGAESRTTGAVLGGMAGAAFVVLRIIGRSSPVLASALWAGGLIGLMWGGQAGYAIGSRIDQTFPRSRRCCACGKEFNV